MMSRRVDDWEGEWGTQEGNWGERSGDVMTGGWGSWGAGSGEGGKSPGTPHDGGCGRLLCWLMVSLVMYWLGGEDISSWG